MPPMSTPPLAPARLRSGTTTMANTKAAMPIGTLMKKIQCQLT